MRKRSNRAAAFLACVVFLLAGNLCAATVTVTVGPGFSFNPSSVTIPPGDTVRWSFVAPSHTTTSDATTGAEVWDSGVVASGNSFSHTFTTIGDHRYYCKTHSVPGGTFMNGVVHVVAPPPVTITSVNPMAGVPGTVVTITGTNFDPGAAVRFGSTAAASVTVVNPTSLQATVPAIAPGVVAITVTNPSGASDTFPGFVVFNPAAIPALDPLLLAALALALGLAGWIVYRQ